jgi:hypothetical protein
MLRGLYAIRSINTKGTGIVTVTPKKIAAVKVAVPKAKKVIKIEKLDL